LNSGIIEQFEQALLAMDRIEAQRILTRAAKKQQTLQYIEDIVVPVLERIGLKWEQGHIPLAQIYMSGRICEELIDSFLPEASPERISHPKIAIAILDDHHLLGKSIISSVLRASGVALEDFGTQDSDGLVEETLKKDIDILLISVLMLASAHHITDVVARLKEQKPSIRLIVGGAPFRFDTELWRTVGADATGHNTNEAIQATWKMIEELS